MGFNLPVKLPVTIGTKPLGASLPKQESQSAPGRDGLKYEICQYGIQVTLGIMNHGYIYLTFIILAKF